MELNQAFNETQKLLVNLNKVIRGKKEQLQMAIVSLIADGHLLVEDVPGVGKTMLAKALARSIHGSFSRIQFTPDLLPSDITGGSIFNQKEHEFEFRKGPIFSNIVLADEINRTTPRTQASLLEAMEESHVTVDGMSYPLPKPFFVIATQNPVEFHGTYPLPEGQLDRFAVSLNIGYPGAETEVEILRSHQTRDPIDELGAVMSVETICELQELVRNVHIENELLKYIVSIANKLRYNKNILIGISPRGTLSIMRNSQAYALLNNRDYVTPDDIKAVIPQTVSHRLIFRTTEWQGTVKVGKLVQEILDEAPVPLIEVQKNK